MSVSYAHWFSASSFFWHRTEGGRCADLILLSPEAAGFRLSLPLLHLPFVYFKVRKRARADGGEKTHIRCVSEAALVHHERHFCPGLKYIALTSP